MPQILFIHSSAFASEIRKENQGSYTRKMARILRETVRGRGVKIVERDVAAKPPGMIDQSFLQARSAHRTASRSTSRPSAMRAPRPTTPSPSATATPWSRCAFPSRSSEAGCAKKSHSDTAFHPELRIFSVPGCFSQKCSFLLAHPTRKSPSVR